MLADLGDALQQGLIWGLVGGIFGGIVGLISWLVKGGKKRGQAPDVSWMKKKDDSSKGAAE
jgi:hypothetical protein